MKETVLKMIIATMLAGLACGAGAAEAPATPAAAKTTQQRLAGKVVALDKKSRSITIVVNGNSYILQLDKNTKIAKASSKGRPGAEQTIDDIRVGEDLQVTVAVAELPSGEMKVTVVSVETDVAEAAGNAKGKRQGPPVPFPGNGTPNLGNSGGGVVSPNK